MLATFGQQGKTPVLWYFLPCWPNKEGGVERRQGDNMLIPKEDYLFECLITIEKERIRILELEGFTRSEAIELLKLWALRGDMKEIVP